MFLVIISRSNVTNNIINLFLANVSILYPLEIPENQRFSGVFRDFKMRTLARNRLRSL